MDVSNKDLIVQILAQNVIPSIKDKHAHSIVVASSRFKEFAERSDLPLGMYVTHKPLQSRQEKVRGKQFFGKMLVNGRWEKDGLHSLRTPKLAIVLKGDITFQCGDALLHCKPGHVIFMPPDVPHSDGSHNHLEETPFPQGNCDILFVGIHAAGLVTWHSITRQGVHRSNGIYRLFEKQSEHYLDLFWEQAISSNRYAMDNCGALLLLLMTTIYNELREYQPAQSTQEEVHTSHTSPRSSVARAKRYIHNHIHEKLTIDEVARHVYLARTQFTSQFRRETGQSFHEYLSDCRFEKAKRLLQDPLHWPVSRVSEKVGLKPAMLRKLFRQRLQISPTEFRERP